MTDALDRAKTNGATTICITHRSTSPITKVSDIRLYTAAKQTAFRSDASSSRIAQLTIIDTLYVGDRPARPRAVLETSAKRARRPKQKRY